MAKLYGLDSLLKENEEDYPVIVAFIKTADCETKDQVHSALMSLGQCGACPITPPIIGGLTAVGYWKRRIEDGWTSREFLNTFIKMCDMFE